MPDIQAQVYIDQQPGGNTTKRDGLSRQSLENFGNVSYSSGSGLMLSIPESAEIHDSHFSSNEGESSLLGGPPTTSPSLARKLTNLLRSPLPSRPGSQRLSSSHLSPFQRSRSSKNYANVHESEDVEMIGIDLSSLAGLGFEEHAMRSPGVLDTPLISDQDTTYISPSSAATRKPDFNEFRARRRQRLGRGLDDGIRLERNSLLAQSDSMHRRNLSSQDVLQRAKTVRNIGQVLAQERGKIVAVEATELVDITNLDGNDFVRRNTDREFDGSATPIVPGKNLKSYFFPPDPDIPDWKPFSISGTFIISLALLAIVLAGFQEYLCQWSIREERHNSGIIAFNKVSEVSVAGFFAWKYLPTMVTIIYAVLFSIMDFDVRRLEPYYQLSQPSGSTASSSLNLDHLTMFQYLVPFNAVRLRHWAVALSTIANILVATVAPALQNPSFNLAENSDPGCATETGCPNDEKKYFVRIDSVWSRLMTSTYLLVATITIVLFVLMRRKSGLLCDPKGIAGIASMATKSHILQDFKGLDTATRSDIHKRLANRRFVLYQSSIWQGELDVHNDPLPERDRNDKSPHPPMLRKTAAAPFIGYMVICLVFVPLITLTKLNIIPNQAPWAPILAATILKLWWSTFEADVRLMEPFYQLSERNAKPENSLTLDYQATVYGIMPFVAAFNGHFLVATVGLCSVLLDILSVTAGSFSVSADILKSSIGNPNNAESSYNDETSVSFLTSLILSMAILTFVIFTTVLVYVRRHHPFLPREPSTIAAVLSFIYASNMLDDFIDTEHMTSSDLEKMLKRKGKRYGLGWIRGRDGQIHCAIDQEPMISEYVHGAPYDKAVAGPLTPQEAFYHV